jgi:hypothetical protein
MTAQHTEVLDSAYARDRAVMVSRHLRARGIEDPLLLVAMGAVPREAFVPEHLQEFSYEDSALPIEAGQTISQPYIVARMLELAEISPVTVDWLPSMSNPMRTTIRVERLGQI